MHTFSRTLVLWPSDSLKIVCGRGSARTPLGKLTTLPQTSGRLGADTLPHIPILSMPSAFRPSTPSASRFGASIPRCVSENFFLKLRPVTCYTVIKLLKGSKLNSSALYVGLLYVGTPSEMFCKMGLHIIQ